MKKLLFTLIGVAAFGFAACNCQAGDALVLSGPVAEPFKLFDKEFQIDLGADYTADAEWSATVGVNYFFNENWGLDFNTSYRHLNNWDFDSSLNVVYRYPIESLRLAPYAFAGLGGIWGSNIEEYWQGGVGVDYRVGDRLGLFLEYTYRWVPPSGWMPEEKDHLLSAGVRITF